MLCEIHNSYGLNFSKVVKTVTDSGTNFIKAFAEFSLLDETQENIENDEIEFDETILNMDSTEYNDEIVQIISIDEKLECSDSLELPSHQRCYSHLLNSLAHKTFDSVHSHNSAHSHEDASAICTQSSGNISSFRHRSISIDGETLADGENFS